MGTAILAGVAGVAAVGIAGYAYHAHNQSQQQQQAAMNAMNTVPPFQGAGMSGQYPPVSGNAYPQQPMQGGAYPPPPMQGGAYPPSSMQGGAYPPLPMQGGAYPPPPMQGGAYPPGGYVGPVTAYPPPPSGFQYAGQPVPYMSRNHSYPAAYSPQQPFVLPVGLPPHLANKMMQASDAFRQFDTNCSGSLSKKEFKRALKHLGFYMQKGQAGELFYSIDVNGSNHISEREFCEWWCYAFPY